MNRWFLLLLVLPLFAFTDIYDKHTTLGQVDDELNNISDAKQDVQFRILTSTPALNDLQDHEVVLVITTGTARIMLRDNVEIYSVNLSCVTVLR